MKIQLSDYLVFEEAVVVHEEKALNDGSVLRRINGDDIDANHIHIAADGTVLSVKINHYYVYNRAQEKQHRQGHEHTRWTQEEYDQICADHHAQLLTLVHNLEDAATIETDFRLLRQMLHEAQTELKDTRPMKLLARIEIQGILQRIFELINCRQDAARKEHEVTCQKHYEQLMDQSTELCRQIEQDEDLDHARSLILVFQDTIRQTHPLYREHRSSLHTIVQQAWQTFYRRREEIRASRQEQQKERENYLKTSIVRLEESITRDQDCLRYLLEKIAGLYHGTRYEELHDSLQERLAQTRQRLESKGAKLTDLKTKLSHLKTT